MVRVVVLLRLLVRGHWRSRRKRYVALASSLGFGLAAFFAFLMLVEGARDSLIAPLESTLTGPLRVTNGTDDLGAGSIWADYRPVAADLSHRLDATVIERFESSYITIRGENYENWSAGLLVGIDPKRDALVADYGAYITWGSAITGDNVFGPDGRAYAPLVVGAEAAKRLDLRLSANGTPEFSHPLIITSGHSLAEGSTPVPLVTEAVVIGVFQTGLDPLDKFTAFIPIGQARYLAGFAENDPVANAFLIKTTDPDAAAATVRETMGLEAVSSEEFAFDYMGSMLLVIYVAGGLGLALFLVILLVWVAHDTQNALRSDQGVISSLRAIGIPSPTIQLGYVGLTTLSVAAGAVVALVLMTVVAPLLPPIEWTLSGLQAAIALRPRPLWMLLIASGAIVAALLVSWVTARRIAGLNILDGLRRV
jgi:ABC-type lipoprotein release transport system permease subunit